MSVYTLNSYSRLVRNAARTGRDITRKDERVSDTIDAIKNETANYKEQLKHTKGNSKRSSEEVAVEVEAFRERREVLKEDLNISKISAIENAVNKLAHEFEQKIFNWGLRLGMEVNSRQTFTIYDDFYRSVTAKQIENVLSRASRRYQPSRQGIVTGLRHVLAKPYRFGVIRTDIEKFFDSIPHDCLLQCLRKNDSVDSVSRYLIEQLLDELACLTGRQVGIPQGVGISSKLAEIFLMNLDQSMITDPRVEYYARFVDDIVIVTKDKNDVDSVALYLKQLLTDRGLILNAEKTLVLEANKDGNFLSRETRLGYLGYEYIKQNGKIETRLTDDRFVRLETRLQRAFELWHSHRKSCRSPESCSADGLLVQRIRFLTSNVRLHNAKERVIVGIYYSNRELTEFEQLEDLDRSLEDLKRGLPHFLAVKLISHSFLEGFKERRFSRFSLSETERITSCWRDLQ